MTYLSMNIRKHFYIIYILNMLVFNFKLIVVNRVYIVIILYLYKVGIYTFLFRGNFCIPIKRIVNQVVLIFHIFLTQNLFV